MKRYRSVIRILAILALFIALVAWKSQQSSEFPQQITLRDGRILRVLAVSYGSNIPPPTTFWRKVLGSLPARFRPAGQQPDAPFRSSAPSLFVIYSLSAAPGSSQSKDTKSPPLKVYDDVGKEPPDFRLVDDHGFESGSAETEWARDGVGALIYGNFPRRSETLTLRLIENENMFRRVFGRKFLNAEQDKVEAPVLRGQLSFRNPFHSQAPPWTIPGSPQRQQARETSVELLEAVASHDPLVQRLPSEDGPLLTTFKLKFQSGTETMTNWSVRSVRESDASGNHFENIFGTVTWENGVAHVSFTEALWPVEPIRYVFKLVRESGFPQSEELTIIDVPLPEAGSSTEINFSTNLLGQDFRVVRIANRPQNDNSEVAGRPPFIPSSKRLSALTVPELHLSIPPPSYEDAYLIVKVIDNNQQDLSAHGGGPSGEYSIYPLNFQKNSKTVTIKVAVQRPIFVEFIAQPKQSR